MEINSKLQSQQRLQQQQHQHAQAQAGPVRTRYLGKDISPAEARAQIRANGAPVTKDHTDDGNIDCISLFRRYV